MKNSSNQSIMKGLTSFVKLACLVAAVYFVVKCIDAQEADDELALLPTPVVINDIKPIGELYALTAITEDFEIDVMENAGFLMTTYPKCIQTLRQQVSFVLDLDSVSYQPIEGTDTVVVSLPPLRFIQSSKGGTFLCEIERSDFDATRLINMVERNIRKKYATDANYQRAMQNAQQVLDAFVRQAGRIPKFQNK